MRTCYVERKFYPDSREVIEQADDILCEMAEDGYTLTLRQLYYQFVSKDLLPNTEASYHRLGSIVNDARLAGLLDWDHMVDRTRKPQRPSVWDSPQEIIRACADQYAEDWWYGQKHRVEVWVEKDALVDIVAKACDPWQVPYFSCRGYVSQSAMYEAAMRLKVWEDITIIHLGDHDPSGIDMTRDIQDRLRMFKVDVPVKRIALTMTQVKRHRPPPNPTKVTDPRAGEYLEVYGHKSWELDALTPKVMRNLIERTIKKFIDFKIWDEVKKESDDGVRYLKKLAKGE